tara:strand:- start:5284 stop:5916 length:633 start_codon:yes stop_codon:yes gene_type:complete
MINIAITLRVSNIDKYNERRDCIDQKWIELLITCGLNPILIPNNLAYVENLIEAKNLSGLILTGGNDLENIGGDAIERDQVENFLLKHCIDNKIPVLGVCRGMQLIQNFFNIKLTPVTNHVDIYHKLFVSKKSKHYSFINKLTLVNSYHNFGTLSSKPPLNTAATSEDGVVMAVEHYELPIFGHMWHPEREYPFNKDQIYFIKYFFGLFT